MSLRLVLAVLWGLSLVFASACSAQTGRLQREDAQGFARISILFDEMPAAKLETKGGVVRIVFDRPVRLLPDRLSAMIPNYISAARLDPDQRTVRLALTGLHKVQLTPLADRFLLDVLPETWRGLPPPPPQDLLDALAERLRVAEQAVKAKTREAPALPFDVMRVSDRGMRLLMSIGPAVPARFERQGDLVRLVLSAPYKLDLPAMRASSPLSVLDIAGETSAAETRITFLLQPGEVARAQREPDGFVLEIGVPQRVAMRETPRMRPADMDERIAAAAAAQSSNQRVRKIQTVRGNNHLRIDLPFETELPIAAYRLGDRFFVLLGRNLTDAPDLSLVGEGFRAQFDADRAQDLSILTFIMPRQEPVRLMARDGFWSVAIGATGVVGGKNLALRRDPEGQVFFDIAASRIVQHLDQQTGVRRLVALAAAPTMLVAVRNEYPQFAVEASAHGLVVTPFGEGIALEKEAPTRLALSRKGGLLLSSSNAQEVGLFDTGAKAVVDLARWERDQNHAGLGPVRARLDTASVTNGIKRALARIDLARLYAAQELYIEALGPFRVALEDEPALRGEADLLLEQAIYAALARRCDLAEAALNLPTLRGRPQTVLWSAYCSAQRGQNVVALMQYRAAMAALPQHPDLIRWALSMSLIDVAMTEREYELAQRLVNDLGALQVDPHRAAQLELRRARLSEELGDTTRAMSHYEPLLSAPDPVIAMAARVAHAELILRTGLGPVSEARAELERVAISWHGDATAARALSVLARHYAQKREWRSALTTARRALERHPDDPAIGALEDDMKARFEELMSVDQTELQPAQIVALFFDFREFAPAGARGDAIVQRLAHRLITLDLLDEAAQLLRFQIENRLQGIARAQAAEILAGVEIARNEPQAALRVLDETRFSDLSPDLVRRRLLLQAKALSATKRPHVALDLISGEVGDDILLLRASIAWDNELWPLAGEALETALGENWRDDVPLSDDERALVLRAALAYLRAQDELSLDRLRGKYLAQMSASPDARIFAGLSSAGRLSPLVRTQTPIDSQMMQGFLNEMRKRSEITKAGPG